MTRREHEHSHVSATAGRDPRISIVTPSFNQEAFLERAIRSVLDQDMPPHEYVVVDGGSTDGSVEVIRRYADRLTWWVSEKDRGQSHAINKGFERCAGDVFAWINSDDYLLPGALRAVADAWRKDADAGAWVGACARVVEDGGEGTPIPVRSLDRDELGRRWPVLYFGQPACFFSAEAWRTCGPLDESLHLAMDTDLWLKMLARFRFARVEATLACATVHPQAKTQAGRHASQAWEWLVRARHGFEEAVVEEMGRALAERASFKARVAAVTGSRWYRLARPLLRLAGLAGRSWEDVTP
jgi:hypothetical protein